MLEAHLKTIFHEIQWDSIYGLDIEQQATRDHLIEAYMDIEQWVIHVKFHDGLPKEFSRMVSKDRVMAGLEQNHLAGMDSTEIDGLEQQFPMGKSFHVLFHDFLASIAYHEFGHSKECPVDLTSFASIIQAVTAALEEKQRFNAVSLRYIANMFCDIIINSIYGLQPRHAFFRNGFFLFHLAELEGAKDLDVAFSHFVLLNAKLYQQNAPARALLESVAANGLTTGYIGKIKELISIFSPNEAIADVLMTGMPLGEENAWKIIGMLSDKEKWPGMARSFALAMVDMIKPDQQPDAMPAPDNYYVKMFFEDEGFKADVLDKIIEGKMKGLVKGDGQDSKNPKKKAGAKASQKPSGTATLPGEQDLETGMQAFDVTAILDSVYRHRIKQMRVTHEDGASKEQVPLTWMSREMLTEKDNLLDLDPMNVYFLPGSNDLLLYKKATPLVEEQAGSVTSEGFPDLAIIYDDSGSMDWNPLEGSGKYDAVIITIYSLLDWLKRCSFAAAISYNFTGFSSSTRTTGWVDYYHLDAVLKLLFFPQAGGTKLDPDVLREILETPRPKVVLIITDGEILNAKAVKSVLHEHKTTTQLAFIQIGKMSGLATSLQNDGIHVVKLEDVKKLSEIALKFVSRAYTKEA